MGYDVPHEDGGLLLTATPQAGAEEPDDVGESVTSRLVPLGAHRFRPEDPRIASHHQWGVVFVPGPDDTIVRMLNGAFPAGRV
ncbi:hypothetical protein [Embleya scabrispora]|uniref:hypothetical protein n=1 Tax=Embleya scabrispora TaxID=159449 RepID=UPI00036548CA|nr:hypothetical protein [Embleya scabrispora]MYS80481.1 hypothetical protein [Streptomyces sp. SID5474]